MENLTFLDFLFVLKHFRVNKLVSKMRSLTIHVKIVSWIVRHIQTINSS